MRIAIIAALPGELKPLVRNWRRDLTNVKGAKRWTVSNDNDTWIAVCAGMGAESARRAFSVASADSPLDMLISLGWAGALQPEVLPGTVHVPTAVIDSQTGERFGVTEEKKKLRLVTTPRVADAAEKKRLAATYPGAALVDMEAATVARLAAMHDIPVLCVKGVSDAVGADLPDLNPFIDTNGQMRMPSFLAHIALRPHCWPSLVQLGKNSACAADAMRDLIQRLMKEKNVEDLIRTGSI